jgi:small subunit ribosomal protein S21
MQREGVFREMKLRGHYEKPSGRRAREKSEAIRRARKLAAKKLQREGLLPMKPRVAVGSVGRNGPARPSRFTESLLEDAARRTCCSRQSKAKAALYSANEPTTFQAWSRARRSRRYGEFPDTIAHTIQCLD